MEVPVVLMLSLAVAAPDFPCGPLFFAHELAQKGELHPNQRLCMNEVASEPGPYRLTASQLLIENASRRGLRGTWKSLTERHLRDIDGEDPVLLLDYARFLFVSDRGEASIAFIDDALTIVERWNDAPDSALTLHRMRTVVAVQLWRAGTGSRERAHDYAADWYAASEALGHPENTAHSLCVTSGDLADCGDGPTVADAGL
jgi:hypothetical protein